MILVDTPIWVDHLRAGDEILAALLAADRVLMHPFVKGEIALGYLQPRQPLLDRLDALPPAKVAADPEVMVLIEQAVLFGTGIGYVDAHLLAATRLTQGASIWTRDKRLAEAAVRLKLGATVTH